MRSRTPRGRLLVLACSASKAAAGATAVDLYQGPAYQVLRRYERELVERYGGTGKAPDPHAPRVMVLSAEHGLVSRYRFLLPYDRKMDAPRAAELAEAVQDAEAALYVPAGPFSDRLEHFPEPLEVLAWGGKLYRQVLASWQEAGLFRGARVHYSHGGIGTQLGQLRRWLDTGEAP